MNRTALTVFVALLCMDLSAIAQDAEVNNSDVFTVEKNGSLASLNAKGHDIGRLKSFMAELPEGHKARILFTTFGASGADPIRHIAIMTALNAEGQPDGKEIEFADWYRNAVRVTTYVKGRQEGVERLFFGGGGNKLKAEIPWTNGKIQGIKKTYHDNGQLASETPYVDSEAHGESRSYSPEGALVRVSRFRNGNRHGDSIDYWPGGKTVQRTVPYKDGEVHGVCRAFYADGKPKWERAFKNNEQHGVEKHYDPDGTVTKTLQWDKGVLTDR